MHPSVQQVINEALSGYRYTVPSDKEQQMYDFYMLTFLVSHLRDDRVDDRLKIVVKDARKDLFNYLKREFLTLVFRAVSGEMRHLHDRFGTQSLEAFLTSDEPLATSAGSGLTRPKGHGIGKSDLTKLPEFLKQSLAFRNGQTLTNAKKSKFDEGGDLEGRESYWMNLAKKFFSVESLWNRQYGGKAWAGIANAWTKLNAAKTPDDMMVWIDHIYDLQHNTGSLFNKEEEYKKDSVQGFSSRGYSWIQKALDHKRDAESPYALFEKISPGMRRISGFVMKAGTGETYHGWREKESKKEKEDPNADFDDWLTQHPEEEGAGLSGLGSFPESDEAQPRGQTWPIKEVRLSVRNVVRDIRTQLLPLGGGKGKIELQTDAWHGDDAEKSLEYYSKWMMGDRQFHFAVGSRKITFYGNNDTTQGYSHDFQQVFVRPFQTKSGGVRPLGMKESFAVAKWYKEYVDKGEKKTDHGPSGPPINIRKPEGAATASGGSLKKSTEALMIKIMNAVKFTSAPFLKSQAKAAGLRTRFVWQIGDQELLFLIGKSRIMIRSEFSVPHSTQKKKWVAILDRDEATKDSNAPLTDREQASITRKYSEAYIGFWREEREKPPKGKGNLQDDPQEPKGQGNLQGDIPENYNPSVQQIIREMLEG